MWDENLLTENEGIGELIYNLQPFFTKCMRDKQPISTHAMAWHPFSHPNYPGVKLVRCLTTHSLANEMSFIMLCSAK
jgi:hypothetical protein